MQYEEFQLEEPESTILKNGRVHKGQSEDSNEEEEHMNGTSRVLDLPEYASHEGDLRCGYGSCKPESLQTCNNPRAFLFWLSFCVFVQGFVVNGINNVNTSTLERRFELSSSQVGLISSSYEIGAGLFVLPITYFGTFGHQPRMIAFAALLTCLGSFIMSLPHFITDQYELGSSIAEVCSATGNMTICEISSSAPDNRYILMLAQLLHGIGGTTIYTLGIVYIDTNVKTENFPLYYGTMVTCQALGPATGYLMGGALLNYYVDFDTVDVDSLHITPADPRWVGAWWMGYVTSGCIFFFIVLGLYPFPKITPEGLKATLHKKSQAHHDGGEKICERSGFFTSWRDIPLALRVLLCNPVMVFSTIATVSESMLVAGYLTFMPKIIQNQFGKTATQSALLTGLINIPGSVLGNLLGSGITRLMKLKLKGMLTFCIVVCSLCVGVSFVALVHCDAANMAGVNVPYGNSSQGILHVVDVMSSCNQECGCTEYGYEPVCGADGIQYFSACHAGCSASNSTSDANIDVYLNCSCVTQNINETVGSALEGPCPAPCTSVPLYMYLGAFFVFIILTMCRFVPATDIKLRCIPQNQRAFSLGIHSLFARCLGAVPGPLLFGLVFDTACLVWQDDCESGRGSCWVYDNSNLSHALFSITIVIKLLQVIFYSLALLLYKPPPVEV